MASKRTYSNVGGFNITAPPDTHFAFNPWVFDFTRYSSTADSAARITLGDTGDIREPYNSAARFDIRRWVQAQFEGVLDELAALRYRGTDIGASPFVKSVSVGTIRVYNSSGSSLGTTTPSAWSAVWGAIGRGEWYGRGETMRRFINFPFTIDVNSTSSVSWGDGYGTTSVNGARLLNPNNVYNTDAVVRTVAVTKQVSVLNQEVALVGKMISLVPDCTPLDAPNRAYLRWVDNLGCLRYWLFTQTAEQEQVTATAWNRAEQPEPDVYDSGYLCDAQMQRQELTAVRVRTLGASLLSEDDWAVVGSIVRSPIIDEFDGYDEDGDPMWHRVNVVAGSYTRERPHLQDFSFQVTDRTQTTQSL